MFMVYFRMFAVLHGFSQENNWPVMKANRTMDESEEVVSASKDLRFQDEKSVVLALPAGDFWVDDSSCFEGGMWDFV